MHIVKIKSTGQIIPGFSQSSPLKGAGIINVVHCPELSYTADQLEEAEISDLEFNTFNIDYNHSVMSYSKKRAIAYPKLGDQMDQLWKWASANGLVPDSSVGRDLDTPEGMGGEIQTVKKKYPKGVTR